jgi:RimJ/RimL family protein N-acetyltransferase
MTYYFQGQIVQLQAVEPREVDRYFVWSNDIDNVRALRPLGFPMNTADIYQQFHDQPVNPEDFNFQIVNLNATLLGVLQTCDSDLRNGVFSYRLFISNEQRRLGYASDAIRIVMRYYMQERRYQKCQVTITENNEAALQLHRKLGFQQEGRLRRTLYADGTFYDQFIYGITREEFAENNLDWM